MPLPFGTVAAGITALLVISLIAVLIERGAANTIAQICIYGLSLSRRIETRQIDQARRMNRRIEELLH